MAQFKILGNLITDFLDKKHGTEPIEIGIYSYEASEQEFLADIEDDRWQYRIRRQPSLTVDGQPGLVDIYTKLRSIDDVFSTSNANPDTYVERNYNGATYDLTLKQALDDPGKTIVMHGPSKLGKTALWQSVLPDSIVVHCTPGMTVNDIYSEAIRGLRNPVLAETIVEDSAESTVTSELGLSTGGTGPQLSLKNAGSWKAAEKESRKYINPTPNITSISVAEAMHASKHSLVLENYHRLDANVLKVFSSDVRTFSDYRVSLILVGIPNDPFALRDFNPELDGRISYLKFGFWEATDLAKIARSGMQALNVDIDEQQIEFLVSEAAGSPLLMQEFCLLPVS